MCKTQLALIKVDLSLGLSTVINTSDGNAIIESPLSGLAVLHTKTKRSLPWDA